MQQELLKIIAGERDARLPVDAHANLVVLAAGLHAVQTMIGSIDKRIVIEHRSNEASKRLRSIPGIGIVGASATSRPYTAKADQTKLARAAVARIPVSNLSEKIV
jgi:hypothetical protein